MNKRNDDMKVTYTPDEHYQIPKNTFVFTLETMTGDADDYHQIEISFDKEDEIKELVVAAETAIQMGWNARGYLFEKHFNEEIHSYEGCRDKPLYYTIVWYDKSGKRFKVTATIDADMQKQIANPDLSEYGYEGDDDD
jgi:hypothetical protein